jgi:hypothetical protein
MRTRDLRACSIAPQATTLARASLLYPYCYLVIKWEGRQNIEQAWEKFLQKYLPKHGKENSVVYMFLDNRIRIEFCTVWCKVVDHIQSNENKDQTWMLRARKLTFKYHELHRISWQANRVLASEEGLYSI